MTKRKKKNRNKKSQIQRHKNIKEQAKYILDNKDKYLDYDVDKAKQIYDLGGWLKDNKQGVLGGALTAAGTAAMFVPGLQGVGASAIGSGVGMMGNEMAQDQKAASAEEALKAQQQNEQDLMNRQQQLMLQSQYKQNNQGVNTYAQGGSLNVDQFKGPSHEQGGIALNPNQEVEGEETKGIGDTKDYVFSDRLRSKYGVSYADVSKKVSKDDERPYDTINARSKQRKLKQLQEEQEEDKKRMQQMQQMQLQAQQQAQQGQQMQQGNMQQQPQQPQVPQGQIQQQGGMQGINSKQQFGYGGGLDDPPLNPKGGINKWWELPITNNILPEYYGEEYSKEDDEIKLNQWKKRPQFSQGEEITNDLSTPDPSNHNYPSPKNLDGVYYQRKPDWNIKNNISSGKENINKLLSPIATLGKDIGNNNKGYKPNWLAVGASGVPQLGAALLNNRMANKLEYEQTSPHLADSEVLDPNRTIQGIEESFGGVNRSIRQNAGGSGNYLSNRIASGASEAGKKADVYSKYDNLNAQAKNKVGMFNARQLSQSDRINTQIKNREISDKVGMKQDAVSAGASGLNNMINTYMKEYRTGQQLPFLGGENYTVGTKNRGFLQGSDITKTFDRQGYRYTTDNSGNTTYFNPFDNDKIESTGKIDDGVLAGIYAEYYNKHSRGDYKSKEKALEAAKKAIKEYKNKKNQ